MPIKIFFQLRPMKVQFKSTALILTVSQVLYWWLETSNSESKLQNLILLINAYNRITQKAFAVNWRRRRILNKWIIGFYLSQVLFKILCPAVWKDRVFRIQILENFGRAKFFVSLCQEASKWDH